jgi:hypothetical protein
VVVQLRMLPEAVAEAVQDPEEAVRVLRFCSNPCCACLDGHSEASLPLPKTCRRCGVTRCCSGACRVSAAAGCVIASG